LEEVKNIFLGDKTIIEARGTTPAWREPQYDTEKQYLEIDPLNRKEPDKLKKSIECLFCYRHAFSLAEETKSVPNGDLLEKFKVIVGKRRECKYHIEYIPGYSPIQHLTRWENLQREQTNRRWSLLYIIIGSIITVLSALAIKLIWG